MNNKDFFKNYGISDEESEILAEYVERTGNTKERALEFADEIINEYNAK